MVESGKGLWYNVAMNMTETMFYGTYRATMDDKYRTRIPKNFRDYLGAGYMLCAGTSGSLFVMSKQEFESKLSLLQDVPTSSLEEQHAVRVIMSRLHRPEEDNQYRFIMPAELRKHAALKKKLVFVGMMNRIEIWSEEAYEAKYMSEDVDVDAAFKALADFGI